MAIKKNLKKNLNLCRMASFYFPFSQKQRKSTTFANKKQDYMKHLGYFMIGVSLLLLSSCSLFKSGAKNKKNLTLTNKITTLAGTTWKLDSIVDFTIEKDLRKPASLGFAIKDGKSRIFGFGGCNHFGGNYSQTEHKIKFTHLLSTKMYCNIGSKTETQYTSVLLRTNQIKMSKDGHLVLLNGDKLLAIFEPQKKSDKK